MEIESSIFIHSEVEIRPEMAEGKGEGLSFFFFNGVEVGSDFFVGEEENVRRGKIGLFITTLYVCLPLSEGNFTIILPLFRSHLRIIMLCISCFFLSTEA